MSSQTNFAKARHDAYSVGHMLRAFTKGFEFKRMSPSIKQYVYQMIEATAAIADACGEERDIAVEVNIWEQLSMTFPRRMLDEEGNPLNEE